MAAHHRLSQVESASTIVTMAYDPVGSRNSKNQRLDDPFHTGRRLRVLDNPCPSRWPTQAGIHLWQSTVHIHTVSLRLCQLTSRIQHLPEQSMPWRQSQRQPCLCRWRFDEKLKCGRPPQRNQSRPKSADNGRSQDRPSQRTVVQNQGELCRIACRKKRHRATV